MAALVISPQQPKRMMKQVDAGVRLAPADIRLLRILAQDATAALPARASFTSASMRAPALVEYERQARARVHAFYLDPATIAGKSRADEVAFHDRELALFGTMYERLTREERAAEGKRLMGEALHSPAPLSLSRLGAQEWHANIVAWSRNVAPTRQREEESAIELAEAALARCTYLGDSLECPEGAETLHMLGCVDADGALTWFDRRDEEGFVVNWSDLVGLDVRTADSPGEQITTNRSALLAPFGWVAKKRRREAVLSIKATWGHARLLVHGQTPRELDAAVSPLRACIGRMPAAELINTDTGIDLDLLHGGDHRAKRAANPRRDSEASAGLWSAASLQAAGPSGDATGGVLGPNGI